MGGVLTASTLSLINREGTKYVRPPIRIVFQLRTLPAKPYSK